MLFLEIDVDPPVSHYLHLFLIFNELSLNSKFKFNTVQLTKYSDLPNKR